MNKKIIIPSDEEVQFYSKGNKSIKILAPNPLQDIELKSVTKQVKNKVNFCSTTKVYYSWKDMVKNVINNTDYGNDKR